MITSYLFFRLKQIGRFLDSIGIGYILLVLLLLSGVIFKGLSNLMIIADTYVIVGFAFLLCGLFFQRKDINFLKGSNLNLYACLIMDALLMGLPFTFLLFLLKKWAAGMGILAICFVIPIIIAAFSDVTRTVPRSKRIGGYFSFLPHKDFELKTMLRQYFWMILPIYMAAIIFSWHIASVFVISFILLLVMQGVFEYYEPKELIFNDEVPALFLWKKAIRIFLLLSLFLLPFLLIGLYSNTSKWYLYILVFITIFIMTSFLVFNKYAFYRPNNYHVKTNILSAIMLIFMFIPGFQLVVLSMTILQFFKARRNLNYYK